MRFQNSLHAWYEEHAKTIEHSIELGNIRESERDMEANHGLP